MAKRARRLTRAQKIEMSKTTPDAVARDREMSSVSVGLVGGGRLRLPAPTDEDDRQMSAGRESLPVDEMMRRFEARGWRVR